MHCPYSPPNGKWGVPPPWLICIVPLTALYVYLHRAYATYAFAHHVMTATVSFIGRYSLHSISFGTLALPSNHSSNPYSCASSSAQLLLGTKSPVAHCSSSFVPTRLLLSAYVPFVTHCPVSPITTSIDGRPLSPHYTLRATPSTYRMAIFWISPTPPHLVSL